MSEAQREIPHDEDSIEDQARRVGWVPEEEYKGRAQWVDATTYLQQLEEDSPRLRHLNEKLLKKLDQMERGQEEILAHHQRMLKQTRDDAYAEALANIEAKHAEAVAAGDVDGAKKALDASRALEKQATAADEAAPAKPAAGKFSPSDQAVIDGWVSDNSEWFGIDPEMTQYATGVEKALAQRGVPLAQRLKTALERTQRRYPQEFTNMSNDTTDDEQPAAPPPRRPAAPVQGRSSNGVRAPSQPKAVFGTYGALTPAGKQACDRFVASNGGKKESQAEWLKFAASDTTLFNS